LYASIKRFFNGTVVLGDVSDDESDILEYDRCRGRSWVSGRTSIDLKKKKKNISQNSRKLTEHIHLDRIFACLIFLTEKSYPEKKI
jgi:hypothetical protein